jgi:bifunctional ADP-heptose synthase (sugar kinase/adenylyltransferase)
MMRIDDDAVSDAATLKDVGNVEMYDAIVISDYNKGVVTYDLIQQLRALFAGPIFVDTKKTDLEKFEGCIVKINQLEHSLIKTTCTDLIVTMGRRGANYNDVLHPAPEVDVADVCGAGDTFLSSLAVAFLETQNIEYAIQFANMAASISVQHSGVYILSQQDISYIYETLNYGV